MRATVWNDRKHDLERSQRLWQKQQRRWSQNSYLSLRQGNRSRQIRAEVNLAHVNWNIVSNRWDGCKVVKLQGCPCQSVVEPSFHRRWQGFPERFRHGLLHFQDQFALSGKVSFDGLQQFPQGLPAAATLDEYRGKQSRRSRWRLALLR